jgi:hypothetical protein
MTVSASRVWSSQAMDYGRGGCRLPLSFSVAAIDPDSRQVIGPAAERNLPSLSYGGKGWIPITKYWLEVLIPMNEFRGLHPSSLRVKSTSRDNSWSWLPRKMVDTWDRGSVRKLCVPEMCSIVVISTSTSYTDKPTRYDRSLPRERLHHLIIPTKTSPKSKKETYERKVQQTNVHTDVCMFTRQRPPFCDPWVWIVC